MDMKEQRFGIEIEFTGITRENAASVVADYFGTRSRYDGTSYGVYSTLDGQGRKWKFVSDASINAERKSGRDVEIAGSEYKVELVSPICKYEDIPTIQEIVRKLRSAGAFSNTSCGIHIHVDASPFDANSLRNITNIMASKEDLIYKALRVEVAREYSYCKKTDTKWLEELNRRKPKTREAVSRIWYSNHKDRHDHNSNTHYHDSRYHCLNLHSVFTKGTVEFRLFNSDIHHAGKIKAYIQLSLAVAAQALNQSSASRIKTQTSNEKYTFRTWLLRLGMIGDEFKTARMHLLEHLDGCIAWRDPAQAIQQKERLRQKREKAMQAAAGAASIAVVPEQGQAGALELDEISEPAEAPELLETSGQAEVPEQIEAPELVEISELLGTFGQLDTPVIAMSMSM